MKCLCLLLLLHFLFPEKKIIFFKKLLLEFTCVLSLSNILVIILDCLFTHQKAFKLFSNLGLIINRAFTIICVQVLCKHKLHVYRRKSVGVGSLDPVALFCHTRLYPFAFPPAVSECHCSTSLQHLALPFY
jgi:hypothetical protein